MPIPARKKSILFYLASFFLGICFLALTPLLTPSNAIAQASPQLSPSPYPLSPNFNTPSLNPEVPRNQHTFAQSAMIEAVSSVFCLVTGIDPVNPAQGCLDIDPKTHKLGLRPPQDGKPQLGGLMGFIPGMFSMVYAPPASSKDYVRYLANNFGITRPAYAAAPSGGFETLKPLLPLWTTSRNVAYLLFVLVFIIIGLAIMLRVKIDPRTVMTLQNQIPRIIVGILLVTFSYAIAGLMVDSMWLLTYAGINTITQASADSNPVATGCSPELTLQQRATQNLLSTPFNYGDQVLKQLCHFIDVSDGLAQMTGDVAWMVGGIVGDTLTQSVTGGTNPNPLACSMTWSFDFIGCIGLMIGMVIGFFAGIAALLIVYIALMWAFFRIWFELLKAYIMVIIYIITAPLWIVMGLLPPGQDQKRPLGFEKWFFRMFAHLAVFPATACLLVVAAVIQNIFNNAPAGSFIPPLVGQPNTKSFGSLLALAFVLITPGLLDIIIQNLHAMSKGGALATKSVAAQIASGAALPKGGFKGAWKAGTYVNPYTNEAEGPLAKWAMGDPGSTREKYVRPILKNLLHVKSKEGEPTKKL